ncbi:MAG: Hint domain-containing protein [Paracoccaceae bacterium]
MATEITVRPYNGSVLALDLLGTNSLVLNAFGASITGTITDGDGFLGSDDNSNTTFNGQPITYIGQGTARPALALGLGTKVPLIAFKAGGQIYFHYPEGPPNPLSALSLETSLTATPYGPICYTDDTLIDTPRGPRAVQDLAAGDLVRDIDGADHPIRWIGRRSVHIPKMLHGALHHWLPVVIRKDAFGPGQPHIPLRVSQQHRILISDAMAELLFASPDVLVPARALLGDIAHIDHACTEVRYHHILCDEHVILRANGLASETLLPAALAQNEAEHGAWDEALGLFPDLTESASIPAAHPILRMWEGRTLARLLRQ